MKVFSLACVAALVVACATATDDEPGDGASSAGGGGGECVAGSACDGACVDLTSDPSNCGQCGRSCVVPGGEALCQDGECSLGECSVGLADCDGDVANGCEHTIACDDGGGCPTSCGTQGTLSCADPCAPVCAPPAEQCNALDDDCNDACDDGAIAGCRVAVHRAYNGSKGHLFTTDLAEATAWGLEAAGFFHLYAGAAADLRPFFRCGKGNGSFFYSESNDCEVTGAPLLTVGFIAPAPGEGKQPTCGAVPLYRIYLPGNHWHFYTHSLAERDAALANGWTDQGIAGYVWLSP